VNTIVNDRMKKMIRLESATRLRTVVYGAMLTIAAGVAETGCQPANPKAAASPVPAGAAKTGAAHSGPSTVIGGIKETELARVELTQDAEKRLGMTEASGGLVAVERKPVPRAVSYGGEVMIPPGRMISVTSPFPATLKAPPGSTVPLPGARVTRGQPIFLVEPHLTPGERANMADALINIEGQVKQAEKQLNIAKIDLDRQKGLVEKHLAGSAALIDAKARYEAAQTALQAAEERRSVILKMAGGGVKPMPATAPVNGVLQNLHSQIDQQVSAGAILFDVAEMDPIWVKVPVYVGDLDRLATDRPAGIGSLADPPGMKVRAALPVVAPGSGDPLAWTVHLFYQVENHDQTLRPGQRVGVTLPMQGAENTLVVPRSALIRDPYGGTWIYEKVGTHAYARRRVLVDRVVGDLAALTTGPKAGAMIVAKGAAELYGAEFGGLK
jgi:RND family efflux transporter MFP subunit